MGASGVPGLEGLAPPVIVFCASHSGSRLLARLLQRMGVFMGARLNESLDSLDIFDHVQWIVGAHPPGFERLPPHADPELVARAAAAFQAHLSGHTAGQPWGWKLPETAHVLPLMMRLFPEARLIHLVRDGRDVAFSPFVAPKDPFWRKIYFGDDQVTRWRGLAMTQRAYRSHGHLFNAARWVRSVTLGRGDGAWAGARYLELRYEALAKEPLGEIARLADFLELAGAPDLAGEAYAGSVEKWRAQPRRRLEELRPILAPTLGRFGYVWETARARWDQTEPSDR